MGEDAKNVYQVNGDNASLIEGFLDWQDQKHPMNYWLQEIKEARFSLRMLRKYQKDYSLAMLLLSWSTRLPDLPKKVTKKLLQKMKETIFVFLRMLRTCQKGQSLAMLPLS